MGHFTWVAGWVFIILAIVDARPVVRSIKDQNEFNKLLKHHAANTGLPVVADFYSDGCGPCRMMAPVYKTLAKEYEGKAVFVKVDTATNRQLQSTYQVNSIPTFLFFGADGKKKNQFSGAGEGQLRQLTKEVVADAERLNVKLTLESLVDYYATHEPSKAAEDVAELHAKCAKMAKGADCEGGAAADLAGKLKKKYKAKPGLSSRFGDASGGANDNKEPPKKAEAKARRQQPEAGTFRGARGAASEASQQPPPAAAVPAGPQLELASLAELEAAVKQRRSDLGLPPPEAAAASAANGGSSTANDEDEDEEDDEEDDDEDLIDPKTPWVEHGGIDRVAILGGGPAGLAAAVYAARAGLKPVVVAPPFGGQLMGKGVDVENYPGLVGQTGPSMVTLMQKQAASFGTLFLEQTVVKAELSPSSSSSGQPIVLHTNHTSLKCHTLIVATGADSKWLGVPGEWSFRGGGVSTCATCDGFLFRDKPVVVVGGGDTAMEDALVLARTSSEVTVVHRSGSFRASKAMAARVLSHPKITVLWHATVKSFEGQLAEGEEGTEDYVHPSLQRVVVSVNDPSAAGEGPVEKVLEVAAAFVAIGHSPNTKLFEGQLETVAGHDGYLKVAPGSTATSVPGVFAAGDVADHMYRQAITSAGSGAMAALDAERYLSERGLGDEPPAAATAGTHSEL